MSNGPEDSAASNREKADQGPEQKRVDKTRLDINLGDLIDPLSESLTAPQEEKNSAPKLTKPKSREAAKTMLESEAPSFSEIKELEKLHSPDLPNQKVVPDPASIPGSEKISRPAKTQLEFSVPVVESLTEDARESGLEPESKKMNRVAKTQLELSIPIVESLTANAHESEPPVTPIQQVPRTLSKQNLSRLRAKKISNTMLELEVSLPETLHEGIEVRKVEDLDKVPTNDPVHNSVKGPVQDSVKGPAKELDKDLDKVSLLAPGAVPGFVAPLSSPSTEARTNPPASLQGEASAESTTPIANAAASSASPSAANEATTSPAKKNPRRREEYVPKTMLDHNMLFTAISNSALREEAKVAALAEERANLPPKPKPVPVKADKPSSACPFKWEETDSKEKYRYCSNCQTPIYNFDGMERPEAEALIFTRENRKKFTLYSRPDGKFMTVDCPLQEKRKKELVMAMVGGTALVIAAVTIIVLMPKESQQQSDTLAPNTVSSGSHRAKSSVRSATNGGNRLQTFQFPDAKSTQSDTETQYSDPDEDGRFWKFDGGR